MGGRFCLFVKLFSLKSRLLCPIIDLEKSSVKSIIKQLYPLFMAQGYFLNFSIFSVSTQFLKILSEGQVIRSGLNKRNGYPQREWPEASVTDPILAPSQTGAERAAVEVSSRYANQNARKTCDHCAPNQRLQRSALVTAMMIAQSQP